jgi:hypothetical protein
MPDSEVKPEKEPTDYLLEDFVANANRGSGIGITLDLGGMLLTGTLIGGKEYFQALGNSIASAIEARDSEAAKAIRESYTKLGDDAQRRYAEYDAALADGGNPHPLEFFHLRSARVLGFGGLTPSEPGFLWRGRLSHVSGFAIGTLSRAERDRP